MWNRSRLRRLTWRELALYGCITYLLNWTCMAYSLRGGAKHGTVFIYPGL